MTDIREFIESAIQQGADEVRPYKWTTTPWGSTPSSVTVTLYDGDTDVSATNLSGSASVAGDVITTPAVTGLTAGKVYRLEIKCTIDGRVEEAWGHIRATR